MENVTGLVISLFAVLGAGAAALMLLVFVSMITERFERSKYMRGLDKRRIDQLEKRVEDIERDIYFNGNA